MRVQRVAGMVLGLLVDDFGPEPPRLFLININVCPVMSCPQDTDIAFENDEFR